MAPSPQGLFMRAFYTFRDSTPISSGNCPPGAKGASKGPEKSPQPKPAALLALVPPGQWVACGGFR